MRVIPNNVDWSATAAWIALVISVTGTIVGPIITAIITNRHQLKLRKLDIQQSAFERYRNNRFSTINSFIAKLGRCLSYPETASITDFGETYHCIYQYVPTEFWDDLDEFYKILISYKWEEAQKRYPLIVRYLSVILKEEPPAKP